MKIAVSSQGDTLDANVNLQFGRCLFFLIVDTDTMEYDVVPNSGVSQAQGAGTQAAQMVADAGAGTVVSGRVGPKAYSALEALEIKILLASPDLSVREAVEKAKEGKLEEMTVRRF